MNAIEVNLDDYLSEDDKAEIAREEFRDALKRALATKNDVERFVGNVAHLFIEKEVNERFGVYGDLRKQLTAKVTELVTKLTPFMIFQRGDGTLRKDDSVAQKIVDDTVRGSRGQVEARVRELLKDIGATEIEYAIHEQVTEMFMRVRP